jgi:transcriptional regulator with XRE-family HTH domain
MGVNMMSARTCIKNARYKLGMSQFEFAAFLGLNKSAISLYETGARCPKFSTIRDIVDKLKTRGIHLEYADLRDDGVD